MSMINLYYSINLTISLSNQHHIHTKAFLFKRRNSTKFLSSWQKTFWMLSCRKILNRSAGNACRATLLLLLNISQNTTSPWVKLQDVMNCYDVKAVCHEIWLTRSFIMFLWFQSKWGQSWWFLYKEPFIHPASCRTSQNTSDDRTINQQLDFFINSLSKHRFRWLCYAHYSELHLEEVQPKAWCSLN